MIQNFEWFYAMNEIIKTLNGAPLTYIVPLTHCRTDDILYKIILDLIIYALAYIKPRNC